jgi:energy-coupling factor transporter ATP-binding protein EcfA2
VSLRGSFQKASADVFLFNTIAHDAALALRALLVCQKKMENEVKNNLKLMILIIAGATINKLLK